MNILEKYKIIKVVLENYKRSEQLEEAFKKASISQENFNKADPIIKLCINKLERETGATYKNIRKSNDELYNIRYTYKEAIKILNKCIIEKVDEKYIWIKGYKFTDDNMQGIKGGVNNVIKYELNKTYKKQITKNISKPFKDWDRGFYFCLNIADNLRHYNKYKNYRAFEVKAKISIKLLHKYFIYRELEATEIIFTREIPKDEIKNIFSKNSKILEIDNYVRGLELINLV